MKDEVLAEMLDNIHERAQNALWTTTTLNRIYDKNVNIVKEMGYTIEEVNGKHLVYKEDQ